MFLYIVSTTLTAQDHFNLLTILLHVQVVKEYTELFSRLVEVN
jgi:hypothetical protein